MVSMLSTYNETELHSALKRWAARPHARFEVDVDGYVVDVVQSDGELVEIQTANFGALRNKLAVLGSKHPVRIIYPVAAQKWIIRRGPDGEHLSRRRSPRKGGVCDVFYELVHLPHLIANPNVTLEVLLTEEEEFRHYRQTRRRRRWRWITDDKRLLKIIECHEFTTAADLAVLLPTSLPEQFTTADLAVALKQKRALAQKMAYCLRGINVLEDVGKRGNALVYRRLTS